jgi:hypothetical protein
VSLLSHAEYTSIKKWVAVEQSVQRDYGTEFKNSIIGMPECAR